MSLGAIWAEAYRPNKLEDVVLNGSEKVLFKEYVEKKEIPHLLFYGPPGTGKTTVARILVKNLEADLLELNASDERGIEVIREKIKKFAMTSAFGKWKIVFLDEADGITTAAQFTLRNILEKYADSCRFIFTVNYIERLIEPIRSRLQLVEFRNLPNNEMYKLLESILVKEKIEFNGDDVMLILDDASGDLRRAINMMQSMVRSGKLEYKSLKDKVDVRELWELTKEKDWKKVREIIECGVDTSYLLEKLFDYCFEELSPDIAVKVIGEYIYRDGMVVNKDLNLLCALVELSNNLF